MTKKIELPIKIDEPTPTNWDWKRLKVMIVSIILVILFICGGSYLFTKVVLSTISIETEKKWFGNNDLGGVEIKISKYLDYKIPEFSKYNIYLVNSSEVNAYAGLGGKIYITKGLLKNLDNQEELAFIIAHEIGHIENRDVIKKLSNEITLKLSLYFMSMYLGFSNDWEKYIDLGDTLYSKNVELKSDEFAINLLKKYDINLGCVIPFFEKDNTRIYNTLTLLSDHPLNQTRINLIKENIQNNNKICKKIKNN